MLTRDDLTAFLLLSEFSTSLLDSCKQSRMNLLPRFRVLRLDRVALIVVHLVGLGYPANCQRKGCSGRDDSDTETHLYWNSISADSSNASRSMVFGYSRRR